jgi:histone H3/H4
MSRIYIRFTNLSEIKMEMIVVKSKVKEVANGCNVSGDFVDALNGAAVSWVQASAKRADANGRKTVQAKDAFVGKHDSKVMLVVKSKVKDVVSGHNISGDYAEALNEVLCWMVAQACARAEANGRKTVGARDL